MSGDRRPAVDPRTYGAGAGDVVDITIRARITRISHSCVIVDIDGAPALAEFGRVAAYLPAEGIVSVALAAPAGVRVCRWCGHARDAHDLDVELTDRVTVSCGDCPGGVCGVPER